MDDIHECEYKKGKMWQVESDGAGTCYCCRCGAEVKQSQLSEVMLSKQRKKRTRY
jgi:hypothetical protein